MRALRLFLVVMVMPATLACGGLSLPSLSQIEQQLPTPPAVVGTQIAEITATVSGEGTTVAVASPTQVTPPTSSPSQVLEQWATHAVASTEYDDPAWSAAQATGAPNTLECGDMDTAWASSAPDSEHEWLELGFDTAVIPAEIHIYETYNPGSIVRVEVIDPESAYHIVWEGSPRVIDECPRVFRVPLKGVAFPVAGVRIVLDQSLVGDWNEIDAVKLIGKAP